MILLSRTLKEVFKNLFMRGFSHYDRQLRNDILVITTIVAQNPGAPMIVSMNQIALILIVEVVGMGGRSPKLCCNSYELCCDAQVYCNVIMVTDTLALCRFFFATFWKLEILLIFYNLLTYLPFMICYFAF